MDKKIKILFVHHDSYLAGGGASDDFVRILKYLHGTGKYEIYAVFPKGERVAEYSKYCYKFFYHTRVFFPVTYVNLLHYYGFFKLFFKNKKEFKSILDFTHYDLAIINVSVLVWPAIFIKNRGIKEIFFIREVIKPLFFKKIIYKILKKNGSFFFTVSENMKKNFMQITGVQNVKTINSALEKDIEEKTVENEELKSILNGYKIHPEIFYSAKNLICIASINDNKNQILIITALGVLKANGNKVPNLFLAGDFKTDEKYYNKLYDAIKGFGLEDKVFFLGHLEKAALYKLLSRMDSLIISSKSEGLPLVLVEAMKFRVPIITTPVGGIQDIIVDNFNGFVMNGTVTSLLSSLSLLDNHELLEIIKLNGYNTYKEKFNLEDNLKIVENVIDSLINK